MHEPDTPSLSATTAHGDAAGHLVPPAGHRPVRLAIWRCGLVASLLVRAARPGLRSLPAAPARAECTRGFEGPQLAGARPDTGSGIAAAGAAVDDRLSQFCRARTV
ncbi:hypothetical protein D3C76_1194460 [compost metagenome]